MIVNAHTSEAIIAQQLADGIYEGVDLTVRHAAEISGYPDPWTWIRARIKAKDYSGIHIADYIPIDCTNGVHQSADVAGIDTYRGYGDQDTPEHIDFISRELWPTLHTMNKVNYNNGTAEQPSPWLASDLHHWINSLAGDVPGGTAVGGEPLVHVDYTEDGIWHFLPADLQAAINESKSKRIFLPWRYSGSALLQGDNMAGWDGMGKLWIYSEAEALGTAVWGNAFSGAGGFYAYPIFYQKKKRTKLRSGGRCACWTLSASAGSTIDFAGISASGDVYSRAATVTNIGVPVCFRLTA